MFMRLRPMLVKEFLQTLKDPRMRAVLIMVPLVQIIVFGYAVTTDITDVRTAVCDLDHSEESRALLSRFFASGYFRRVATPSRPGDAASLLDRGEAAAVILIDHGFAERLHGRRAAPVQMVLDGTDSNTAGIVVGYAQRIIADHNRALLRSDAGSAVGVALEPVGLEERAWFNANLESRNFYVPGVIALLVMVITIMLSAMAVVREKEVGTLEQLLVTPIRPWEFILGKTAPFALIGLFDVLLITTVAVFWFDVPIRGNLLVLLAATLLYLLSMLGMGLFLSTVSRTQQQAMMTAFFYFLPANLLSGFLYPIANMPEAVQWVTYANPLRYYLVVVRGVFLKGAGFEVLWPQFVGLGVLGLLMQGLALARFRKKLG